ncbi:MAG: alpha/beta hydrolase [Candidatus Lokiarchaeota archaeon]|nr:alpha/beta hydrolase [Candidatus Lokiarchaeota archaeon]
MAGEIPTIIPYPLTSGTLKPAMIVVPGGGYCSRAPHEGIPVAEWLNSIGIAAFVLNYRVFPFCFPVPFLDAQRATRYVRHHAARFNVDPNHIGMLGFSAGGHLTSMAGALRKRDWFPPEHVPDAVDAEPDALECIVLCYAVINMDTHKHPGVLANLMGKYPDPDIVSQLSTERQVSESTPPAFLWTTRDDAIVPIVHSELFRDALARFHIEHELHVFEHGRHGLGLAPSNPDVHQWITLCHAWLSRIGFT